MLQTSSYILNNQSTSVLIKNLEADTTGKYKILNKKEEKELIEKFKDNRDTLNRELINHNIRLVFSICKKYATKIDDFDDLVMRGMYGLVLAAQRFNINADVKFCTYATWWIRKFVLAPFYDHYNNEIKTFSVELDSEISANAFKSNSNSKSTSYLDIIENKLSPDYKNPVKEIDDDLLAFDYKTIVENITEDVNSSPILSATDKMIYQLYFVENYSIKEISAQIGIENNIVYGCKKKVNSFIKDTLKTKYNISKFADI